MLPILIWLLTFRVDVLATFAISKSKRFLLCIMTTVCLLNLATAINLVVEVQKQTEDTTQGLRHQNSDVVESTQSESSGSEYESESKSTGLDPVRVHRLSDFSLSPWRVRV